MISSRASFLFFLPRAFSVGFSLSILQGVILFFSYFSSYDFFYVTGSALFLISTRKILSSSERREKSVYGVKLQNIADDG